MSGLESFDEEGRAAAEGVAGSAALRRQVEKVAVIALEADIRVVLVAHDAPVLAERDVLEKFHRDRLAAVALEHVKDLLGVDEAGVIDEDVQARVRDGA